MRHEEDKEQRHLMTWAHARSRMWPELRLLHAIPNGGRRDKREAARLKAQGVKAGVPDLFLPVARDPYHGLWIEMKRADQSARPSIFQKQWIEALREQGYAVEVCHGWLEAHRVITDYLTRSLRVVDGQLA